MRLERWIRMLSLRVRSLFRQRLVDQELDDELAYHLDRLVEQHTAAGMTPIEARRTALAAMDGFQQRKEECRDMRHVRVIEELVQDLRFACRQFRSNPGFTTVVVLVLALAIGGNTAIFSVVRSAFLQDGFNLRRSDRTDRVEGVRTTPGFFEALSIPPARGRVFTADDVATDHVVLLSDRMWRAMFDGNPNIVGQAVVLDGTLHTIIGVLPSHFPRFGREDLYTPLPVTPQFATDRGTRSLGVIGRLRGDLSLAAARQRMTEVSLELARRYPNDESGMTASLQPVQEAYVQDARFLLALLMGAVACALAVACINVASLLLARGLARQRELAIRTALGGGRWRLTRQLLTEHLLLAGAAGVISIIPAWWGVRLITSYHLEELPNAELAGLNIPVLAFNFAVALLTGALCGVVPAWLAWKHDVNGALKGSPNVDAGRTQRRLRSAFVVGQIALTVMLLVGGGLMLRSFLRLVSESPGYNPENVLTMRVALSDAQYASPERQVAFFERVIERARALPGVLGVSATRELPTSDDVHGSGLLFPGQPEPRAEDVPLVLQTAVLADYFRVMQVPLAGGRSFSRADTKESPPVAVIDEWTARRYWPNQHPVGQRLKTGRKQPWREIVGVVGNVEAPLVVRFLKGRVGQVYLPLAQDPSPRMSLVVRADEDATALVAPMRAIVREVDVDQPVFRVQTLNEMRVEGRRVVRLVTTVLSGFALMALLLATVGLYGTVAYDVGQRTREFGLRISLGAQPSTVMAMVLRHGSRLLVLGAGVGFVGAFASTRMVANFLYGVQASDPLTFTVAVLLLTISGCLATYMPARRATKIDPIVALRCE